ncbi:uncharacterized protein LOC119733369 [Patiria miniata]|uniref:Uncharacterized protein n=1 Tax=Patiria miniata TaxID=46514 RepID=A0A914AHM5_PATMI|nr:uncharacterized protein LOC119733369 [Patiria miniata]XP_038062883.1 uncharacterized protein LOC119733369 [Patiria miniata]XP_038062884.1 uncharacterized protein LOC119733369 [Patiria miniata]
MILFDPCKLGISQSSPVYGGRVERMQPCGMAVTTSSHFLTPVSRFGEQHEPMSGMHHNMAMGDGGGMTAHGMAGTVWNPVATMQLHSTNPKVWGARSQSVM